MRVFLFLLACLIQPALSHAAEVFVSGTGGYHTFRIPSAVVTSQGTVLAFCEGRKNSRSDTGDIDLVLRRSTDGGKTWGALQVVWDDAENTCGNPCPVLDRETGTLWLLLTWNAGKIHEKNIQPGFGADSRRVFVTHSKDEGLSWSEPVEITRATKRESWAWYATGPGAGIQLQRGTNKGRLVIPCDFKEPRAGGAHWGSHVIYSDDHGQSWQLGGVAPKGQVNECEVVELSDGLLMLNMRNYDRSTPARQVCFSWDGGLSWTDQHHQPELIEPVCQASIRRLRWGGRERPGLILFSNPASIKGRKNLVVRGSFDDGRSWPVQKTLHPGSSAYSCLCVFGADKAGCLYEKDDYQRIVFTRIDADELARPLEGPLDPFLGEPQLETQPLFKGGRMPNIVVTLKGTLLVTWGTSAVVARRSEDGGTTWGPEIVISKPGFQGGGTTVDESTGDILAFVEDRHPPAPLTIWRSKDDGKTWAKSDFTIKPDSKGNPPSMHMNEHGITLRHGKHKGRLIRPARYYGKKNARSEWPSHYTNAIYSDDGGKSWVTSDPFPENGTGEATIAELSDGTLYYNSRVHWQERPKNTRRRSAISRDGGHTWTDFRIEETLPDGHQHRSYGCMGGLVRLPVAGRDILVFSNIDTPNAKREKGTVWASFDGGKTWPVKRLVNPGGSAYSSLNAGRPGTPSEGWIYLHYESGGGKVARFNLSWLLAGELTGDGEVPKELR